MNTTHHSFRKSRNLVSTALVAGLCGFTALAAGAGEARATWACETIDGSGSSPVVAVGASTMFSGLPWSFYGQGLGRQRNSVKSFGSWTHDTVDGDSSITGQTSDSVSTRSAASIFGSEINLFYTDNTLHTLRRAHGALTGFTPSQITSYPGSQTAQLTSGVASAVYGGNLYVFYAEFGSHITAPFGNGLLRVGIFNGSTFTFSIIDGNASGGGGRVDGDMSDPAVVIDTVNPSSPIIRLYYFDKTHCRLREAFSFDGSTWGFSDLDGVATGGGRINGCVGAMPSATFTTTAGTHVFYSDVNNGNLRSAALVPGQNWSFTTVDGDSTLNGHVNANVGDVSATLIDENGVPNVFYRDADHAALRTATWNGSVWTASTLDGGSGSHACTGSTTEFALGTVSAVEDTVNHLRHVFYSTAFSGNGAPTLLRHAQFTP